MFKLSICVIFSLQVLYCAAWTYEDQSGWPFEFPACGGFEQTPINILTATTMYSPELSFELINYDRVRKDFTIINDGHSIRINYVGEVSLAPLLTGSAVNFEVYRLAQFHSHWGTNKYEGSEHTVDGIQYPFETHFVHYNAKYASLTEALGKVDGVVVLGVFSKYSTFFPNRELDLFSSMARELGNVTNQEFAINTSMNLRNFLPKNLKRFYTYPGSLTTPPCTEKVTWLLLDEPTVIKKHQLRVFRDHHTTNWRQTQYRGNRIIRSSFKAQLPLIEDNKNDIV